MPRRAKDTSKPIARQVNMLEAKTQLSRIVAAISEGTIDEVIVARDGEPAARIVPLEKKRGGIILGLAAGKYPEIDWDAFNALDPEIEELMLNGPLLPPESSEDKAA